MIEGPKCYTKLTFKLPVTKLNKQCDLLNSLCCGYYLFSKNNFGTACFR